MPSDEELLQIMAAVYKVMASQELARAIAQMYKHILHALVEEGFSREEAIQILVNFRPGAK